LLTGPAIASGVSINHYGSALLQTWDNALEHSAGGERDTPVTKVVTLLKEMGKTLANEMKEDEELYNKLACWCSNNKYEKDNAIQAATAKVAELQSTIDSTAARKAELTSSLAELEESVAADKKSLAEATAMREKQLAEFHQEETDGIQNIEALKAAILVLGKHTSAPPESTVAGGAIFKSEKDSWSSLLTVNSHGFPWRESSSDEKNERALDDFMRSNGFDVHPQEELPQAPASHPQQKFLQQESGAMATETGVSKEATATEWSAADLGIVQRAMKSANAFVQAHHAEGYYPAYTAQGGQIVGVLKQLKEEMESNLSEAQKQENERAAAFAELRSAKTVQIQSQERMAEQKEDELATAVIVLAEAKEDLEKEEASLAEDQLFMKNLATTCGEAETDFAARKQARMAEMTALSETIAILQQDTARDAMSSTFSLLQVASGSGTSLHQRRAMQHRRQAASAALRRAAGQVHDPELSILATKVELDSFTRVKKAIDDMIAILRTQQSDEVKKTDWCKAEFHENEMSTARNTDEKAGLEAKVADLESSVKSLQDGIADAKANIAQLQLELQRATEVRKAENQEFQKTIADQTTTIEVLHKALNKLATYYDLLQTQAHGHSKQTPPVPQKEYKPNQGARGVMEMIEKLANDAKELMVASKHSENSAQAAYEQNIADTNGSVEALQKEVTFKIQAKSRAGKDMAAAQSDLADTNEELEGLAKYNANLHAECDYMLKNFDVRQSARAQEIEALQQAKQILSGASLS